MKKTVAIVGGGAAGMATAAHLDQTQFDITIYEKSKAVGRKFLVAGVGGFNLTHAEPIADMIQKYTPHSFLEVPVTKFDNEAVKHWFGEMGIPTFIGSSQRVFPEEQFKPIQVLDAVLEHLQSRGVKIETEKEWLGWQDETELIFKDGTKVKADYTIYSLGGSSWKVTGSDGLWSKFFEDKNIETVPFQGSNCRFLIQWPEAFVKQYEGSPLKNIAIESDKQYQKGEVVISKNGIEGNAVYALSPRIRTQLKKDGQAIVNLDLKPAWTKVQILSKMTQKQNDKITDVLRNTIKLSKVQIALLKALTSKEEFSDIKTLIKKIKRLPLVIHALSPIDEAISTVGGIALTELNDQFELKKMPSHFVIGEMLDWDAPTGGYLLQGCFSMGVFVAQKINDGQVSE